MYIALIFTAAACTATQPQLNETNITKISVVMDNNYPPYAFVDSQGNMQGISVDQWKLWEEHTGVEVEITGLPWNEAVRQMENGAFDVIDTFFYTEERANLFIYTEAYATIDVHIFFPNSLSGIADTEDLKGFRVAVKKGDANASYLLAHDITDLSYYNSYEEIVQAAAKKEEAIFVMDEPPAWYFIYKYGIQNNFNLSEPLYSGEFHRAVKKEDQQLLELVNKGFSSITTSEYHEINNRWLGLTYPANLSHIMPYLGIGMAIILLAILTLVIFNKSLQTRVHERTKKLKETLSNLQNSEQRFRDSIDFLPIPISIADSQGNIQVVNKKFTEQFGYELKDMPTIPEWMALAYPEDRYRTEVLKQWTDDVANATKNNTATPLREYNVTDKDGGLHNAEIIMRPTKDLWVASFFEITERKLAEKKMQESEERYRTLFEESPVPLLEEDFSVIKTFIDKLQKAGVQDFEGYFEEHVEESKKILQMAKVLDVNRAAMKWYPAASKDTVRVPLSQLMNPEEYKTFALEIAALIKGQNRYQVSVSRHTRDGNLLHLIVNGIIVPGYESSWGRVIISIMDITERKKTEHDLNERLKEISCLYAIRHDMGLDISTRQLCNRMILHLKTAMQYPEIAIPVIEVNDLRVEAEGYHKGLSHELHADILSQNEIIGKIWVYYTEEKPFILPEEQRLLKAIVNDFAQWTERKQAVDALSQESAANAKLAKELQEAYETTLEGWSHAMDLRDKETEGHTRRVTELSLQLARKFELNDEEILNIRRGALLHDIGKMGIPDSILLKPELLTEEEWQVMKNHPSYAQQMISQIEYLKPALDIPYSHHEKWDGTGYPRGLKGGEIPLAARIFAIVDVWDALSADRPYRNAWPREKIIDYMVRESGRHFDPNVTAIFLGMLEKGEI